MIRKIINIAKHLVYLALGRFVANDGSASVGELEFMVELIKKSGVELIGETGFNAGSSSYAFLRASPETEVVSFDIGYHGYVKPAKKLIDKEFPGRHTLICGDSKKTLPKFAKDHPGFKFDYIFIDGGHDYKTAKADIINFKELSNAETIVIMDDLVPWLPWGVGPTRAWREAIDDGLVTQRELFIDGKRFEEIKPPGKNGWAVGSYIY